MRKKNILLCLCLFASICLNAARPVLKFQGKTFKIVQFTDIHWITGAEHQIKNDSTIRVMNKILDEEKPDFVVYTGDVVVSENAYHGWDVCLAPCISRKIPYAVAFGNHDSEHGVSRSAIFDYIVRKPYNLTTNAGANVSGYGNCVRPLYNKDKKKNVWNFYLID